MGEVRTALVLALAWAMAAIVMLVASGVNAAPAMWRVRDADSQIYLFGTLHALDDCADWRTPAYDAAYREATTLWFETDLDSATPATVTDIVARYGVDAVRPLSAKLAAPQLRALRRQADLKRIDHLRPWAAALMLSVAPEVTRGATMEKGADLVVTRQARAQAKTVRTFETLEDQARVFASLPEPAEVRYLADVVNERAKPRWRRIARFGHDPKTLQAAWIAGDLARLGPGLVGDMRAENPALYEALLKRRNLVWAETLTTEMAGSGVELVNVGALHMVGADGLPALMRARGFTVERVQ